MEVRVGILDGPDIVEIPACRYAGIRVVTPFRGMLAVRNRLIDELHAWFDDRNLPDRGRTFFRLHLVNMDGPMDIEVGIGTPGGIEGDERVRPGVRPGGRYARLTYVNHARRANRTLVEWIRDSDLRMDSKNEPGGERFACRYEEYVTDPREERMKSRWRVTLNIRLADG
jgi:effector-binding domain-containing protein